MTELKPSMMLRYFTNDLGKHYTAVVLKNEKILSLKKAGEKDKTIYDSLIHWLATLPGTVTISDLDIKERETSPKAPTSLKKVASPRVHGHPCRQGHAPQEPPRQRHAPEAARLRRR
jgi:hypothetical protein